MPNDVMLHEAALYKFRFSFYIAALFSCSFSHSLRGERCGVINQLCKHPTACLSMSFIIKEKWILMPQILKLPEKKGDLVPQSSTLKSPLSVRALW